ncbi:unnamed protein product, partial [Heterotrigona itama]
EQILEEGIEEPRFGFNLLEPIRRSFCQNFCTSFETMSYIANLACAVKCPELYLPHKTTEPPTATTLLPITIMQNTSTTTTTVATTASTTTSVATTPPPTTMSTMPPGS